jgi:hypothetical protein
MSEHNEESIVDSPERDVFAEAPLPFVEFLESYPMRTPQKVSGYAELDRYGDYQKLAPQIRLWCSNELCEGYRLFNGSWHRAGDLGKKQLARDFLVYKCRNCSMTEKTFSILSIYIPSKADEDQTLGVAIKVGEYPELHIDIPSSLPSLLGTDYSTFIKGLKCEKQGFGIGAFAYYRRIVENQKGRVFDQIIKVAERLKAPDAALITLRKAAKETQFAKAVDMAKDFIPTALLSDGHSPLKLLHRALSIGIHASDDSTCLKIAHSIRMVLQDLAIRVKDTLREERELKGAISDLMQLKQES